jgi:hypothetical protein
LIVGGGKNDWQRVRPIVELMRERGVPSVDSPKAIAASEFMQQVAADLLNAVDGGNVNEVAIWALRFGVAFFRVSYEFLKPRIETADRVVKGGKKGNLATYGSVEERQRKYAEWQRSIEDKMKVNSALSYEQACKGVAKIEGVSLKTIKRNTRNPRRRGKSGGSGK